MRLHPFGEWLPDQPSFANPGATIARNTLPRTTSSYGPMASLSSITNSLAGRIQGAYSAQDNGGNAFTFCGDASNLYRLSGTTFLQVSKAPGAYSVAVTDRIGFETFGNRIVAAMGPADPLQTFLMGTDTSFSDLSASAPNARHVGVIRDFLMVGNTVDSVDGARPNRVWWPAIADATNWPTPGTPAAAAAQSDYQDLPIGGAVTAITGAIGGMDGAIFCEKAIYRVVYQGPPTIFGFYEVERDRGAVAPASVVNVGTHGFYLGEEGFYAFNGSGSHPIGDQKVDKTFFADLDQNHFDRIVGAADTINKMVFWAYPGAGSTNGTPNKLLVYNWSIGRWSFGEVECDLIFRDLTAGYTLEELDAFGTLDGLPFSLDSRAWAGGRLALSAFDPTHSLCRFAGPSLEADLETAETGGDVRIWVSGVRPIVDGGSPTVQLCHRATPQATLSETTLNPVSADGAAHFSLSTRYARARVRIPAGSDWQHAQGIYLDAKPDGTR